MKSNFVRLKSILVNEGVSSGYSVRGKISHLPNGGIRIIQLKDFNDTYTAVEDNCFRISADKIKTKYFLENGDILFTAKGTNNYAVVFERADDIPTIASSALFVIQVDHKIANPHFIAWYINQNNVQNYFITNKTGTYTTSINKKTVEETPIALPPLEIQNRIAEITKLHIEEQRINTLLNELKNKLISNQLINIL